MHTSQTPSSPIEVRCTTKGEDCIIQSFYWCSYPVRNTHSTNSVSCFNRFPWCKVWFYCSACYFLPFHFSWKGNIALLKRDDSFLVGFLFIIASVLWLHSTFELLFLFLTELYACFQFNVYTTSGKSRCQDLCVSI